MSKYLLALDQGTTSSRAMVVDATGTIVGLDQREFEQIFPKPGWVEHNAEEIWESQLATARGAIEKAGVAAGDIAGIGITNQRETTVLWDRATGKPCGNAIVWQDRRTSDFCTGLKAERGEAVQQKTGLVVDAYFSGSKLRWMLEQDAELRKRAEAGELAFGTVDSWLVWNLTGGRLHISDVTNACRTMLFNTESMAWDDDLLDWLSVPRAVLPETRPSSEVYGETDSELFGAPIPIAGIAGDQHAALFGQACHSPGMAKNTYGTGCFMLMNTGEERKLSNNNLLSTLAWQIGDRVEYALEGSVFIAGAAIQWLRDQLGIIGTAPEVEELAASVEDNGGVYFVPAFAGLGAPHWDQYARGTIVGLTRGSNKAHIARAALESLAYQTAEVLRAMEADSGIDMKELRVDGGASMNRLLMQFQSDLMGVPVVRPSNTETTALGAAYLAGLATGVWKDRAEIREYWKVDLRLEPAMEHERAAEMFATWKRAVECAKGWEQAGG